MAYTPTTWTTGDTITASAMNKIENGIANAGSALICTCAYDSGDYVLDKTVSEIYDAYFAGTPIFIKFSDGTGYDQYQSYHFMMPVVQLYNYAYQDVIRIMAIRAKQQTVSNAYYSWTPAVMIFEASNASDYPMYQKTIYATASSVGVNTGLDY